MRNFLCAPVILFFFCCATAAQEKQVSRAEPSRVYELYSPTASGSDGEVAELLPLSPEELKKAIELTSKDPSQKLRVHRKVWDKILKGEVLIPLQYVPTRTARNMAALEAEKHTVKSLEMINAFAKNRLDRVKKAGKSTISAEEMTRLENGYIKTSADLLAQREKVKVFDGDSTPYEPEAPFAGTLIWRSPKLVPGYQIANTIPVEKLLILADLSAGMRARVKCDPDDLHRIEKVQVIHIRTKKVLDGTVGASDYLNQTLLIEFPNSDEVIRPGERLEVTLHLTPLPKE